MTLATAPDPSDCPAFAGAQSLLTALEEQLERIARHRRALDLADTARLQLLTALEAVLAALSPDARRPLNERLGVLLGAHAPRRGRAPDDAQAAAMALLAEWDEPSIKVADVERGLRRAGLKPRRGYASAAMARLARAGMAVRTGHGRYRPLRTHPDLIALRLQGLETLRREFDDEEQAWRVRLER